MTMLRPLMPEEARGIVQTGTERPFSGEYTHHVAPGTCICRRCGTPLYRSEHAFRPHCGWPSFDDGIPGAVRRVPDADGLRAKIVGAACGDHLRHVFAGEGFTPQDTRHGVNSLALGFIPGGAARQLSGPAAAPARVAAPGRATPAALTAAPARWSATRPCAGEPASW